MGDDWRPEETSFSTHLIAGAIAGTAEHCGMFPVDTIKTHLQASKSKISAQSAVRLIVAQHGGGALFRGISAIALTSAPAHAVYFSVYEFLKRKFGANTQQHTPVRNAGAGVIATMLSDAVMTPADAVKQRMQLNVNPYRNIIHCILSVRQSEGIFALYAGYTTTITMSVPYNAIYFASYETIRKMLSKDLNEYSPFTYCVAGGGAGSVAAAITNPLDVAKTRLQTQGETGRHYRGMLDALVTIWKTEGVAGYTRGIGPRVLFYSTSSAVCWSVYEYFKNLLK